MGNSILKSILYLIISTVIISTIYIFNNGIYSFGSLYQSLLYILKNYSILLLLLSQLLYMITTVEFSTSRLIIYTLVSWFLFIIILKFLPEFTSTNSLVSKSEELYIVREYSAPRISLYILNYFDLIWNSIGNRLHIEVTYTSSLILLIFNISLLFLSEKILPGNTIFKVLLSFVLVLFIIYLFIDFFGFSLIILSFILLKIRGKNDLKSS